MALLCESYSVRWQAGRIPSFETKDVRGTSDATLVQSADEERRDAGGRVADTVCVPEKLRTVAAAICIVYSINSRNRLKLRTSPTI